MNRSALLVASLALALPSIALADDGAPAATADRSVASIMDRPTTIALVLGLGSPTGAAGLEVERALARWLSMAAGAGIGFDGGPQVAAIARLRLPLGPRSALGLGTGVSYGDLHQSGPLTGEVRLDGGVWLNGELSAELRALNGFVFRAAIGLGAAARVASCREAPDDDPTEFKACDDGTEHTRLPSIAISLGRAF